MDIQRKGSEIIIDLDKEEDAIGLYAVLSGQSQGIAKEVIEKGQLIYAWLYGEVQRLAQFFPTETAHKYMSPRKKKG
jgi:hypothetical protein